MSNDSKNIDHITDHLFRLESGKMVSVLTKIFGVANLETAEDVVQQSFIDALQVWKVNGIPDNPSAWLFRVAKNKAIDIIRRNKRSVQYDFTDSERILLTSEYSIVSTMENFWREDLVKDDQLKMMFACCHPGISLENQITLILKLLCGFSTSEIAKTFLTSEDTVSKRLYRTKEFFRKQKIKLEIPFAEDLKERTDAVLNAVYLLFNEGYNSTHADELIREDLITEAMTLCHLLASNKHTQQPETFALMALIFFHASRNESRLTPEGEIILLASQDRSKWNKELFQSGNQYLNLAAFGNRISTYHLEAAIAYEHCAAKSYEDTNWKRILELYEWLCKIAPSPVTELNKAIAAMQVYGAATALEMLENKEDMKKLANYYLYHSLLGEIYARLNNSKDSRNSFETAISLTQSEKEKKMLQEKILRLSWF